LVRVCHQRAGLCLISAASNRGVLRWMVLDRAVKAPALIRFLQRPVRDARCKVFLILDRLRVHRARAVRGWLPSTTPGSESSTCPPTVRMRRLSKSPAPIRSYFQHSTFHYAA
jgi:hypothetical protein